MRLIGRVPDSFKLFTLNFGTKHHHGRLADANGFTNLDFSRDIGLTDKEEHDTTGGQNYSSVGTNLGGPWRILVPARQIWVTPTAGRSEPWRQELAGLSAHQHLHTAFSYIDLDTLPAGAI